MNKACGFTLLELMMTLAVAAILLTLVAPSYRSMVQNNRAATQTNSLVTALNFARSEAVKRGSRVSICASSNQTSCSDSSDWATGWIVFTDNSGAPDSLDAGDTLLRVAGALTGSTALVSTSGEQFLQYLSNGQINEYPAGPTPIPTPVTFSLTVPDCTGDNVRNVSISLPGRVSQLPATACP
jgi:type IV fimbrial biogenesis protein FimT